MTEWKEIQGYPRYLISNEGQIKFKGDSDNPESDWPLWKNGTTALRDINDKLSKVMSIQRLVAENFVECQLTDKPSLDCYYVKHIDGDKTNNRADNLYWSSSPHGLSMKPETPRIPRIPRQLKTSVYITHCDSRKSLLVYTLHNGQKKQKEFRYIRIGKDAAMEKANEYVKKFKEEHNIEL